MKSIRYYIAFAAALCAAVGLSITLSGAALAGTSSVDPKATNILKQMTDYLGGKNQFKVETVNTLEMLHPAGHRIDIDIVSDVIVSRPDKLRAERRGEMIEQIFFYDGSNLTLYNPHKKVYATEPVPDNYLELFRFMAEKFGFAVPVSDLILEDAYNLLMEEVNFAAWLGQLKLDGVLCDHLLFSRPGVDFQLWVRSGDTPLPYKYIVTDTTQSDRLSIRTRMSDWNFDPGVKDSDFTFIPNKDTQKIKFLPF